MGFSGMVQNGTKSHALALTGRNLYGLLSKNNKRTKKEPSGTRETTQTRFSQNGEQRLKEKRERSRKIPGETAPKINSHLDRSTRETESTIPG